MLVGKLYVYSNGHDQRVLPTHCSSNEHTTIYNMQRQLTQTNEDVDESDAANSAIDAMFSFIFIDFVE